MQFDMCGFPGDSCYFFNQLKYLELIDLDSCFPFHFFKCLLEYFQTLEYIVVSSDIIIDVNQIYENFFFMISILQERSDDFDVFKIINSILFFISFKFDKNNVLSKRIDIRYLK